MHYEQSKKEKLPISETNKGFSYIEGERWTGLMVKAEWDCDDGRTDGL